ncbi:chemotaxis response regulator protein-glutamate methylesterase [Anaerocolumna cellulosilytica]|uniref:Protein-glutamate methylesterase/protein-glutamine glutaminase n=1 Tax=Anaerocolumna cellulosilytica TaxID=433286 RepID=A0A6S6QX64_9FIRM|nr:chemotaxis-specific protein-glutamate methyltransferase CheB [Anaerocolumna cellulosilytica]MBB5197010.1 two-component system chemotaxis response regulator CheB [Anaerocolumna cellulosilytica]BCJ95224.1 chemotaxis response regulator protein-glutamate methylesterase [Anaerocolumna cellulosilytica]
MQKKVLIVDDSALMRRVLSDIINLDSRFQVCKLATNGLEAFQLLAQEREVYDAIILDINMPKMNGLELLEELEKHNVKANIIIVSTVAKEGTKETIRALELGAFDFVTKPDSFFEVKSDNFKNKIIDCLVMATKLYEAPAKEMFLQDVAGYRKNRTMSTEQTLHRPEIISLQPDMRPVHTSEFKPAFKRGGKKLVAIACSTGGPKALQQVIPKLTQSLGCSVLIVQHMPEGFTASLANRLNEMSKLEVKEANDREVIKSGTAYIAKGGSQMRLVQTENGQQLSVTLESARNGLKPCADILFESLMHSDFSEITCVVLTGMGGDGTYGIKQLKEKKNIYVIAQDEATSTVYGMPKVVAEAGLVNEILPLDQIAGAILKNLGVQ